jgi:VWFA-related protein
MKVLALLVVTVFAAVALAQPAPRPLEDPSLYTLKVDVDLALFNVTVLDHKDRRVPGLGLTNFRVFEDGQPQPINFFRADDVPATIGLVIDCSGSMMQRRERVIGAAMAFAKASNPADEIFIVYFNERTTMPLSGQTGFTSNISELQRALNTMRAGGRTALYDAVDTALKQVDRGSHQRKALIVLSDGEDNASRLQLTNALERIQQSNAMVYTVGIYDPGDKDKNPGVLKKLAKAGGAEAYFPQYPHELAEIWGRIADGIRSQYTLGFTPSRTDKEEYRRVTVMATGRDGKTLRVRTRDGYRTTGAVLP